MSLRLSRLAGILSPARTLRAPLSAGATARREIWCMPSVSQRGPTSYVLGEYRSLCAKNRALAERMQLLDQGMYQRQITNSVRTLLQQQQQQQREEQDQKSEASMPGQSTPSGARSELGAISTSASASTTSSSVQNGKPNPNAAENVASSKTASITEPAGSEKKSAADHAGPIDPATVSWKEARDPKKLWILLKRAPSDLVHFLKHTWSGMKLLAADVRVSYKIVKRVLAGKQLSRRERNLLVSTGADLARLVPFSFFLIVPFMEFALPFALKLFPNMLPSQFQDSVKREEDLKRQLKLRLELAKYLQDVVEEKAKVIRTSSNKDDQVKAQATELSNFLSDLRAGKPVIETDVFRFARLFSDEYTLEGAVRPQLVAMCKYMGIQPYGSDAFLRIRLRQRLASIKQDDMQIMWEGGVDSLSEDELLKACRDRGIRTSSVSKRRLRAQLSDWLQMSQNREVPATLMIISRALFYTDLPKEALKETLSSLPQDVLDDVHGATQSESSMSSEERLKEVRRQEKLVEIEVAREKEEEEKRKAKMQQELELKMKREEESGGLDGRAPQLEGEKVVTEPGVAPTAPDQEFGAWEESADIAKKEAMLEKQLFGDSAEAAAAPQEGISTPSYPSSPQKQQQAPTLPPQLQAQPPASQQEHVDVESNIESQQNVQKVAQMLLRMMDVSAVNQERLELEQLKAELREATGKLDESKGDSQVKKLNKMILKLEKEIEKVDMKVGIKLKLLDVDNDGMVRLDEILQAIQISSIGNKEGMELASEYVLQELRKDQHGVDLYSVDHLRKSLKKLAATQEGHGQ
ncbi:LETM1 and EF-hand domain-containing protein 1, mitochondrial [Porphyridium purpureum]|uniref:LETM1 and EF-hand domain-containing protein 1, mitochondrial n=1 Tax=Porphyridium purpureum TaxID=35688 RepID=A0A5J4Z3C7_PORPP|nr:LETM1 and EF-hand domain-containing protein 1, mitochondrial [Porphyridium purpureum]|eukprot:POR0737..scf295_1